MKLSKIFPKKVFLYFGKCNILVLRLKNLRRKLSWLKSKKKPTLIKVFQAVE